jgi:ParB/RepB/Spo0J family partition protein
MSSTRLIPAGTVAHPPSGQAAQPVLRPPATWHAVPLADINSDCVRFQFRLGMGSDDLQESLRWHGQLDPIDLIGPERPLTILDGFRRVHAARALGWSSIRAVIHMDLGERESVLLAFTKNVVRRNLSPVEKANAMYVATSLGLTLPDLASVFRLSERQVRRYLHVLELPSEVQELLDGRIVTMAHGRLLADYRVPDLASWAARIREQSLSVAELRSALRAARGLRGGRARRRIVLKGKGGIRVFGFTIRHAASRADRAAAIERLEEVLRVLREAQAAHAAARGSRTGGGGS